MTKRERIALVTGAGRGIGRAIALELAKDGCVVIVTARTETEINEVAAAIRDEGGRADTIAADLSAEKAAYQLIDTIRHEHGSVNVLVNNAGIGSSDGPQALVDFDDAFWERTFQLNVHVPFQLTKRCLPDMLAAGWGRIINIGSINSKTPALHAAAYTASKHALGGLTKAAALEVGPQGITVNAICPGVTATRLNDRRIDYDADRLAVSKDEIEAQASPLGRRLTPDEIAGLARFLASDASGAINGQLINVCGGRHIS